MKKCSVDSCTNKSLSRGFCNIHYQRWYKTGSPLTPPQHNHGRGNRENIISYRSAHQRVQRDRGKANQYPCFWHDCKNIADEWCYNHKDPNVLLEIKNNRKKEYSLSSEYYLALCKRHHEYFDLLYRRGIPLTKEEEIVYYYSTQSSA